MVSVEKKTEFLDVIQENFLQGFDKLMVEVKLYPNDWTIWIRERNISNSAGNLCFYLVNTFNYSFEVLSGVVVGKERKNATQLSRTELMERIESTKVFIRETFRSITDETLDQEFPLAYRDRQVKTSAYLIYLLAELHYSIGQINYHRRLI